MLALSPRSLVMASQYNTLTVGLTHPGAEIIRTLAQQQCKAAGRGRRRSQIIVASLQEDTPAAGLTQFQLAEESAAQTQLSPGEGAIGRPTLLMLQCAAAACPTGLWRCPLDCSILLPVPEHCPCLVCSSKIWPVSVAHPCHKCFVDRRSQCIDCQGT